MGLGMFANAQVVEAPKARKAKKDAAVEQVEGLEALAAINAAIKALEGRKAALDAQVKAQMHEHFVNEAARTGARPANYKGVENEAEGSLQLKDRSCASVLSPEEVDLLNEHGVPVERRVMQEAGWFFNSDYMMDAKLVRQIEKALGRIKGLPEDLILRQEEVSAPVIAEDSIDAVCAIEDKATVSALLPVVSTMAVRATIGDNYMAVIDRLMETEAL